jgi:hypothetical protein
VQQRGSVSSSHVVDRASIRFVCRLLFCFGPRPPLFSLPSSGLSFCQQPCAILMARRLYGLQIQVCQRCLRFWFKDSGSWPWLRPGVNVQQVNQHVHRVDRQHSSSWPSAFDGVWPSRQILKALWKGMSPSWTCLPPPASFLGNLDRHISMVIGHVRGQHRSP